MLSRIEDPGSCTDVQPENPIGKFISSNIDILIIGAGTAGLYLAIESVRQGHRPVVIESKPEDTQPFGDFFLLGDSAVKNLQYWPILNKEMEQSFQDTWLTYHTHDGTVLTGPFPMMERVGKILIRKKMQAMMIAEAKRQNIPIHYGDKVVDYFEIGSKGGVVLQSGRRLEADLVAACDGVHSRSWKLVLERKQEPVNTGYSIYRCSMPTEQAFKAPGMTEKFNRVVDKDGKDHDGFNFLFGPNIHANMTVAKDRVCWLLVYKDKKKDADSTESWANYVRPDQVLRTITEAAPGWNEAFVNLVKASPPVVDWRLMTRNPEPKWVSDGGHVVQVGDSAHPFLPTSANGATQAMEDAVSLATCLRIAGGPKGIPTAVRVHNKLRFERVSCSQLQGLLNRERMHQTDWKKPGTASELAKVGPGKWIAIHNPEQYAIDNFHKCAESLKLGSKTTFTNTNIPPGYTFELWDAQKIMKAAAEGKRHQVAGDWT